ncbi:MAG: gamma-glutamylcyclotransferase [Alphaproteobacteria bacterium]|nr:gamma-glutamylcyclotransferase [Alphaproteobacteria bacterium]
MTEHLFSYGTLRQEEVQLASFGRLLKGSADALVGWKQEMVEITDASVLARSGKRHHPILVPGDAADRVPGMVFEVTSEELAAADRYEVADYRRVAAKLASGLTAWVYVKA